MIENNALITENILPLLLYALAEADKDANQALVDILDTAILGTISIYKKNSGTKDIWVHCAHLYKEILKSIQEKEGIPTISSLSAFVLKEK